jgi:hypothetical protein
MAEEHLLIYANIVAREYNVPVCVLYLLSKLNRDFNNETQWRLSRIKLIYNKYARRLANGYHKRLIAHPIKYTGHCTRFASISTMMNRVQGVQFLCTEPPLFSTNFLTTHVPALTNICVMLAHPVEFYYQIIAGKSMICFGKVEREDIIELPMRTQVGRARMLERYGGEDIPAEMLLPGRYFVDLKLPTNLNPLTLSPTNFQLDQIYLVVTPNVTWSECGDTLQGNLIPDIHFMLRYVTHLCIQFKTAPNDPNIDLNGVFLSGDPHHIDKFSFVRNIEKTELRIAKQKIIAHTSAFIDADTYEETYEANTPMDITADAILDSESDHDHDSESED